MSAWSACGHLLHQYAPEKKQRNMINLEKHLRDNGYSYLIGSADIDIRHFYDDERRCRIVYLLNNGEMQRPIEAQCPKAFIGKLQARGFEPVRNEDYKGPSEDAAARALMDMWNVRPPRLESQTSDGRPPSSDMDLSPPAPPVSPPVNPPCPPPPPQSFIPPPPPSPQQQQQQQFLYASSSLPSQHASGQGPTAVPLDAIMVKAQRFDTLLRRVNTLMQEVNALTQEANECRSDVIRSVLVNMAGDGGWHAQLGIPALIASMMSSRSL